MSNKSIPTQDNVVGAPRFARTEIEPQDLGSIANGTIGTGSKKTVEKKTNIVDNSTKMEKVAVFSEKNLSWSGVGKLIRGYNILDKAVADKWLSKNKGVRLATPEEIMKEYDI